MSWNSTYEPPAGAVLDPGPGGAPATQSADERAHADRKDVLAPQAVPDTRELVRSRDRLRPGRHERSVQRTRRRSHQYIGGDPPFVDRPQHPDLEGPQAGAAGELGLLACGVCEAVHSAYECWQQCKLAQRGLAFARYRAALDREEQAARVYSICAD
jgi:hypothetical protein